MSSKRYFPILKTTVSEIRALRQMDCTGDSFIHPIFELTKARKSKKDEVGDVFKRINEIQEIVKDNHFILDLTSEESLTNTQIESFFDDTDSFSNWCDFIKSLVELGLNVSPVIQAYDDNTVEELKLQMQKLSELCNHFSIRIKPSYFDMDIAKKLLAAAQGFSFSTIIDLEYIDQENMTQSLESLKQFISLINDKELSFGSLILCSSSFPAMVDHKNQFSGSFISYEKDVYDTVKKANPELQFHYGDYGAVHPFRNDITAYNWVPRIDYPLDRAVIFYRKQRDLGGYKDCASRLINDSQFQSSKIDCWGYDEILTAAKEPNGKSPSYWISVRINTHMKRVVEWLK